MITGRPTHYNEEMLETAWDYLANYNKTYDHSIPSLVGLCKVLNRGKTTLYTWAEDETKDFRDIIDAINEYQHFELVEGGLSGTFNSTIAKLLLHKHGHSDKQETELFGNEEKPLGIAITYAGVKSTGKRVKKKEEAKE